MRDLYRGAALPADRLLLGRVGAAAARLHGKLAALDRRALPISDYNKRYLGEYLANPHCLQPFTYLLAWSLAWSPVPADEAGFLDYGGGCGVMSFLAKEAGLGTVIYNDIYDLSCRDARTLGEALGLSADHYVQGDAGEVVRRIRETGTACHIAASNDVIEHVHDIDALLRELPRVNDGPLVMAHASTANPCNPLTRRRLMRLQRDLEERDRPPVWGRKERDERRAYLTVRREMIARHAPSLPAEQVDRLARATRGLMERDIRRCVDTFAATGLVDRRPDHPTNTCDPTTGNWAEHLMDIAALRDRLAAAGFEARLMPGYYGSSLDSIKGWAGTLLNAAIRAGAGLRIAPYFLLLTRRGVEP